MNLAIVRGRLSSEPRITELTSGDVVVRYEVTVAVDGGPDESVPVAWIGPGASRPVPDAGAGDEVVVRGRVLRRWYRAGAAGARSATEVRAEAVVAAGDTRRAAALLRRAGAALDERR